MSAPPPAKKLRRRTGQNLRRQFRILNTTMKNNGSSLLIKLVPVNREADYGAWRLGF